MEVSAGVWSSVIVGLLVAVTGYIYKYIRDKNLKDLSDKIDAGNREHDETKRRVTKVEADHQECLDGRKEDQAKLLASMEREQVLREVLPSKLVAGIEKLCIQGEKQTTHLGTQTRLLEKWGSDPMKICRSAMTEERVTSLIKTLIENGTKVDRIEMVLDQLINQQEKNLN